MICMQANSYREPSPQAWSLAGVYGLGRRAVACSQLMGQHQRSCRARNHVFTPIACGSLGAWDAAVDLANTFFLILRRKVRSS